MRPSSRKRGRSSASRTKGTRLHGAQNLLDLPLDPGKPDEAGAPRLPDRPQGLRPHGPRRPNQDQERDRVRIVGLDDHAAAAHVRDQGLGGGYDELLQPVQEHRAVAEEEEPAGDERERGFAE
nr:hypothetical protein CFP56_46911 [Quercus suber]